MQFDRATIKNGLKVFLKKHNAYLTARKEKAVSGLLDGFEDYPQWDSIPKIAYCLATVFHETAGTFEPIQEYGSKARFERLYGHTTRKGKELGNTEPGDGIKYSGKGFVQLTGKSNFKRAEKELNVLLVKHPELAMIPANAFPIMTFGMSEGWFTGKKLSDYFTPNKKDYINARRIINGTDKAALIATYARDFEQILNSAVQNADSSTNPSATLPEPSSPSESSVPPIPFSGDLDTTSRENTINPGLPDTPQQAENILNIGNVAPQTPDKPFSQYLPTITKEKRALGLGMAGTAFAWACSWFTNLPLPVQIALGVLLILIVAGFIWLIVANRKLINQIILDAMQLKADKSKNSPIIVTEKPTEAQQIPQPLAPLVKR
jgi:putative chitinase